MQELVYIELLSSSISHPEKKRAFLQVHMLSGEVHALLVWDEGS